MSNSKDLNWLSAPAFFLIVGILAFHSVNQSNHNRQQEKVKPHMAVLPLKK
jgi:hypothetical protein